MKATGLLLLTVCLAAGCGAQEELLGSGGSTLLTTMDALAVPRRPVELTARLQHGDLLSGKPGYVIRFDSPDAPTLAAQTNDSGEVRVRFIPPDIGDYTFTVSVSPVGLTDQPPLPQKITVVCRAASEPIVIVDLDKTLVASGFETVLLGDGAAAKAMPHSQDVLQRLRKTHTIVYLTHRPDYFGLKSRTWLAAHGYPHGPLLLSTVSGFLSGSEAFKTAMIASLREKFSRIDIGIGDKLSDGLAYVNNDMKAYVIVQAEPGQTGPQLQELAAEVRKLPATIQVVSGWDQVSAGLFEGQRFPPDQAADRLAAEGARRPAPEQP